MSKQSLGFIFIVLFGVLSVPSMSHAMDMSDALKRMDAIIAEMKALRTEFASLLDTVKPTTATPAVLGSTSGGVLGDDIIFGSTNDDIKKIQKLLATDPTIYPYGAVTGFYGPKTRDAIRAFQARFDLDTVGVVGPSTRALLEVFFAAYPADTYPDDVLKKSKPTLSQAQNDTLVKKPQVTAGGKLRSITVKEEDDEYIVKSYRKDGTRNRDLILYPKNTDDLVDMIAQKLNVTKAVVQSLVSDDDLEVRSRKHTGTNTAGIDTIDVEVREDDAIARVEYVDDTATKKLRIREVKPKDIIEALSDRLDISAQIIQEVIALDYGAIRKVITKHSGSKIRVYVTFDSGITQKFTFDDDQTKRTVSDFIAKELSVSRKELQNELDFDF